MSEDSFEKDLFTGLRQLADAAFPKRCAHCGRVFRNSEEFLLLRSMYVQIAAR